MVTDYADDGVMVSQQRLKQIDQNKKKRDKIIIVCERKRKKKSKREIQIKYV